MNATIIAGGAGFIGSNFAREWTAQAAGEVLVFDKLTYAGNLRNLTDLNHHYIFERGDIANREAVGQALRRHRPALLVNFASETHVDRSIHWPLRFVETNVLGVSNLLEETRLYWERLSAQEKAAFRFVHVSTDEVYGSLGEGEAQANEQAPYRPNSPYAASKAAADHLVRAYNRTFGIPTLTANCSNAYGPRQHPEKLIPLTILNALEGKPLPIYGDGNYLRDWLEVGDLCAALRMLIARGRSGESYNIGSGSRETVLSVVRLVCSVLDELRPSRRGRYSDLIVHVADRPGHDRCYAMDTIKARSELSWSHRETLAGGIRKTVLWYLNNPDWVEDAVTGDGDYGDWIALNYGHRGAR